MAEQFARHLRERSTGYVLSVIGAVFGFAMIFSLWQAFFVTAAGSEVALIDMVTSTGSQYVRPGTTVTALRFIVSSTAGEKLSSSTFKINSVNSVTTTDFNQNSSVSNGVGALLYKDVNGNNLPDSGTDTIVGGISGSSLLVNATNTFSIDGDGDFGNGFQADTITTSSYMLVLLMSTSSATGDVFNVSMTAGTATYQLNTTTVSITSAGLVTTNITVDGTAPTMLSSMPPHNQTNVPLDSLKRMTMSESLATSTVTTSTIVLRANAGNAQNGEPTGPNLCSGAGLSGFEITCGHSPLSTTTWYSLFLFSGVLDRAGNALATSTIVFRTNDFNPNMMVTPPFVISSFPTNGNQSVPTNAIISVDFPGSVSGLMATSGAGSILSASNVLLQTVTNGVPSGSNLITASNLAFSSDSLPMARHALTVTPASALTASTTYALTIKNTAKNSAGINSGNDFILTFKTIGGADTTAPTFANMMPASGTTGVALNVGDIVVQFSKDMNAATLTTSSIRLFKDTNDNGVLNAGESIAVSTTIKYEGMQKAAHIGLKTILTANTKYCVEAGIGAADVFTNAFASAAIRCFTTTATAYSAVAPTVTFADGDNFKLWVAFDQPIDPTDAVNKDNYQVESPVSTTLNLANATLNYRAEGKGVEITGIGMATNQQFKVTVTGVKDLGGGATIANNGTTNVARGMVQNSITTGGMVGGLDKPDFASTNFGTFWEKPTRCSPTTLATSKTSRFMCEFSVPAALTSGAQVILTLPTGFGLVGATTISAVNSPMNADLNGFGPGVTTIAGITTSSAANTITLTLTHTTSTAMGSSDQLRFELGGITNPSAAGSQSVSIIVKDSSGIKQGQTLNAAPFTINSAGSLGISGKVCKGSTSGGACGGDDTGIENAKVFASSPVGGHQETTTAANGTYSFTGLSAGTYNVSLFIDPSVASDMAGGSNFQSVTISGSSVTAVDFKKADVSSSGKTLTVAITGGPASTDMDVFCFAPNNVQSSAPTMKMVTTNGSGAASTNLKVQPNTTYQCGIGPHISFNSISSGSSLALPDFSFMPPRPQTVTVGSVDTNISFALTVASQQIIGKVTDGSGTAIANVYVDARPIGCFDTTTGALTNCQGSSAQTKSDGTFVLKITNGTYQVGACAPGMPCSTPVEVTVKSNTGASDNNSTADIYTGGTLVTSATGITMKLSKSDVTIAGQVLDESSNAIKYAFVQARKVGASDTCTSYTPSGGDTGSPTDSSGNYTLYVSNGTWRVEAYAGTYGQVNCSIITVSSGTSKTGQNLQAQSTAYGTISGTVTKASTATQGAQVNCFGSAGGNQTISGSDGTYSIKVKAGTYRCEGFLPGAGPLTPVTDVVVAASGSATANLTIGTPGTVTIALGSTVTDAFCDARNSSGRGMGTGQNSSGTYSLYLPADTYTVRCGSPKIGEVGSQSVTVTAGGSHTVTFTPPTLFTVSGRVTDGSSNLEGASITLTDKTNGRSIFKQSDATAGTDSNVSISIPAGTYSVNAGKAGYVDSASAQTLVVSANTTFTTRSLTKATANASVTVALDGANYTGEARVIATRSSDSKVITADIDETTTSTANASVPLTDGTWTLVAFGDNGKKSAETTVTVTGGSVSAAPTLSLATTISGYTAAQTQQPVVPSTGGLFKDSSISSNFEINIPTGALSTSDSNAGTLETKTNATLAIDTVGKDFLGTSAIDITPKNSSGQKITELSSAATIKIPYSEADVPSGIDESKLQCATWNDATGEWETLSTTVDTTNNVLTCQTTHFSTFGAIAPTSGGTTPASSSSGSSGSSSGGGGASIIPLPPVLATGATAFVTVNNGASETNSRQITLQFAADNADQVAVSTKADFSDAAYRAYTKTLAWQLSPGDGVKTLYIRFRSKSGGMVDQAVTIRLNSKATATPVTNENASQPVTTPVVSPTVAALQFTKNLQPGSSVADVKALQIKLQALGYLDAKIVPNGIYGPATTAAVKKFQKANKISQLGTVGPATRAVLNSR